MPNISIDVKKIAFPIGDALTMSFFFGSNKKQHDYNVKWYNLTIMLQWYILYHMLFGPTTT